MGQKIYVRNIGEDALNITIDGAEQAGSVFHHAGRITIEPELLKRVEIEAGAANATSGPGALGGSVRFITKDPSDLLRDGQNFGALLKSTVSSNGNGIKNSATLYGRTEDSTTQAMVHLTDSNHDNYEDGNGDELPGTELEETLGFLKVKTTFNDEHTLSLSHENVSEEGDVLYRPEWIPSNRNAVEPSSADRQTTTLNYRFTDNQNDLIDTKVTVYQTNNEQSRESSGTKYSGNVESTGLTLQNTSLINQHEITYGINYRDDESYFYESGAHVEQGTVIGLYLQDSIELNSDLTLSAGARYDQYELTDVNDSELDDNGLSPNLGIVYQINDSWNVTANYAQALRGAEIKDAFKLTAGVSNSDDLKAETAKNLEFGVNYKTDALTVSMGVYQSIIEDGIGLETPWAKESINYDFDIETEGYYLDLTYQMNKLTAGLHFHSADTTANDQIVTRYVYGSTANSIGDTLVLSMDYQLSKLFSMGWSAEMVKGIHDIELNVGGQDLNVDKPGYAVHNIYAKWLPLGDDKLTLSLTVNNLFNKQYISHASVADYTANSGYEIVSGSASTGRDVLLSAALKF